MKNILNKLFKTWIILIGSISVIGFLFYTTILLHDSYVVYLELLKVKEFVPTINPGGNTFNELEKIPQSKDITLKILNKTNISVEYDCYSVKKLTWGDQDFSNFNFILMISLWLVFGASIIILSFGLKLWLKWLIQKE